MKFRAQHYATRFSMFVETGDDSHYCTVSSISVSGACIIVGDILVVGEAVVFEYPGGKAPAVVKWVTSDKVGLAFKHPLTAPQVDRIRFGVQASRMPMAHTMGFTELR